jgi:hypothetical protein
VFDVRKRDRRVRDGQPWRPARFHPTSIVIAGMFVLGCDSIGPGDPGRRQLNGLVEKGATRQEVIATLGPGSTWYGRQGDVDYPHLVASLRREPASWGKPLRDAVARGEGILFYTSSWQMTWLFFDRADRLRGYWITAQ